MSRTVIVIKLEIFIAVIFYTSHDSSSRLIDTQIVIFINAYTFSYFLMIALIYVYYYYYYYYC
jgi:hypothetical protein